jgi:uncharacterized repeat protein (TIGR02543 family)
MKHCGKTPIPALLAALLLPVLTGCGDLPGGSGEETCAVSFDAQGGLPAPAPQTLAKGGRAEKPADPVLEGHTLAGWYLSLGDGAAWDFALDRVEQDITLYARWTQTVLEEGTWELSFNTQGGGVLEPLLVRDGETAERPPDPVRTGYRFDGWHKEAACENPWDFALDRVSANTTLYAKWTPRTRTVHFDPQGGTPVPPDQILEPGSRVTQPVIAREGFLLEGWSLSPEGGAAWDFARDTVEEDITLHARWTEAGAGKAVATFDTQGGSPVPPPQSIDQGGNATKPEDPLKTGFEFDGWFKEPAGLSPWDFAQDRVEGDTILYAKWTAVYTITFDSRGGSEVETLTLRAGSSPEKPGDPVRGPDRFDGWYSSVTDTPWTFGSPVTGSIALYARWTPVWSVDFDSRGGGAVAKIEAVFDGDTIPAPADPSRDNNAFDGWHKEAACVNRWDFAAEAVTESITLYAKWTATVRFDANGGSGAPPDQTVTSGSPMSAPANPLRESWSFVGWHREAAGTNPWNFAEDPVNGHMTLYAKWEVIPVTGIARVPSDGVVNETLDLDAAAVVPDNASVKAIAWTVKEPGGAGLDASAAPPFVPAAPGTLVLIATVRGGGKDASGNPVDYTGEFSISVTAIRKVTAIGNVPTNGFTGIAVDLSRATVSPANATNKAIVWTIKEGAGAALNGAVLTPAATGTLVVTATVVNGDEDDDGTLRDYTQDFSIAVDTPASKPGGVGLGEDTTIKLYAGAGTTPLSAAAAIPVAKDSAYYVRIDSSYTNIVWHLNGRRSTAAGNRLYLDTGRTGLVKVTVEAEKNGVLDSGSYTFRIE